MKIEFSVEGGVAYFPGLSKPTLIDSDELPAAGAAELRRLVDAAHFFDLPATHAAVRGAADYQQYTISVQAGRRRHTARVADPIADPALQDLVDALKALRSPDR